MQGKAFGLAFSDHFLLSIVCVSLPKGSKLCYQRPTMPDIQKVSVALTGEQVSAMRAAVETGEYATTGEVIREALREWQWKRKLRNEELNRVRHLSNEGETSSTPAPLDSVSTRDRPRVKLNKANKRPAQGITEIERNEIVSKAHREFVESGVLIRDVFGRLRK